MDKDDPDVFAKSKQYDKIEKLLEELRLPGELLIDTVRRLKALCETPFGKKRRHY